MSTLGWRKMTCKHGHDISVVGRNNLNQCKACVTARTKKTVARRTLVRKWIGEIKQKAGCADCGFNKWPEALDFDHLSEKICDVTEMVDREYSTDEILKEIAKCEVVCANCHRHRTAERKTDLTKASA